jgi:hypothetical protein
MFGSILSCLLLAVPLALSLIALSRPPARDDVSVPARPLVYRLPRHRALPKR